MCGPVNAKSIHQTCYDEMRDRHGTSAKDRKWTSSGSIEAEDYRDARYKLADIHDSGENQGHFIGLSERTEESGCVVYKRVNSRELQRLVYQKKKKNCRESIIPVERKEWREQQMSAGGILVETVISIALFLLK